MTGRIAGIARHAELRGPIETLDSVTISVESGLEGDVRGIVKPGGRGRRQVTLIEAGDWAAATAEAGVELPWHARRANLLVEGFDLPQRDGARLRIGDAVLLEVKLECEPCERMDELAPGLRAAMKGDWRGGACAKVLAGGTVAIGDAIRIDE